jgi:ABC-2 type transport system permease protein
VKLGYLALETRRGLRNPRFLLFTIVLPAMLYLVYVSIFPGTVPGSGLPFASYHLATLGALGSFMAATASTAQTAVERSTGWQRQLRLTPLTTASYLSTKVAVAMTVSIAPIVVIATIARLARDVQLSAGAWVQVVLGIWLATLPFALFGLVLGQFADARNLPAYLNGTLMIMALLGGLFVPVMSFPAWLATLAKALPTYWIGEIGRSAMTGNSQLAPAVAALGCWAVAAGGVVVWRYQRGTERA